MIELKKLPKGWRWLKLNEISAKISLNKIKIKQKDYLKEGKYSPLRNVCNAAV